jgi:hypothetical protein
MNESIRIVIIRDLLGVKAQLIRCAIVYDVMACAVMGIKELEYMRFNVLKIKYSPYKAQITEISPLIRLANIRDKRAREYFLSKNSLRNRINKNTVGTSRSKRGIW